MADFYKIVTYMLHECQVTAGCQPVSWPEEDNVASLHEIANKWFTEYKPGYQYNIYDIFALGVEMGRVAMAEEMFDIADQISHGEIKNLYRGEDQIAEWEQEEETK